MMNNNYKITVLDLLVVIVSFYIGWLSTSGVKTQFIRLVDVFLYGPFFICLGVMTNNQVLKYLLFFIGASTASYNLKNYIYENNKIKN